MNNEREERKILRYVNKAMEVGSQIEEQQASIPSTSSMTSIKAVVTGIGDKETFQRRGLNNKVRREAEYDGPRYLQLVPDRPRPSQEKCPRCGHMVDETTHGWFKDEITRQPVPCTACSPRVRLARLRRLTDNKIKDLVQCYKLQDMQNMPTWADELSLDNYPDIGDQNAKKKVQAFIRDVFSNLFLTGDTGRGKTGLAIAAVKQLAVQGVQVIFLPAKQYFSLLQENFSHPDNHIKYIAKTVQVLVLDDLGTERVTDSGYTVEETGEIIEARLNAGLRTLITSNFDLQGLASYWSMEKYEKAGFQPGKRLTSRIGGTFQIVKFNGPDLRLHGDALE